MGDFKAVLPLIKTQFPKSRWILLTLTVPNCPINELRATIKRMNKAWHRFVMRKQFKPVIGWIKSIEVTQEEKRANYAHPHFHVLLMVPPSMLSGANYVSHGTWLQMWRDCYRDQSITMVNVKAVKGSADKGAIETLKAFNYSLKVDDLINRSPDFILEYMRQVQALKFIALGGVLKDLLLMTPLNPVKDDDDDKEKKPAPAEDEADTEDIEDIEEGATIRVATWRPSESRYRMKKV